MAKISDPLGDVQSSACCADDPTRECIPPNTRPTSPINGPNDIAPDICRDAYIPLLVAPIPLPHRYPWSQRHRTLDRTPASGLTSGIAHGEIIAFAATTHDSLDDVRRDSEVLPQLRPARLHQDQDGALPTIWIMDANDRRHSNPAPTSTSFHNRFMPYGESTITSSLIVSREHTIPRT